MSAHKLFFYSALLIVLPAFFLPGCATAPPSGSMPMYSIGGIQYVPLPALCSSYAMEWRIDRKANTVSLQKGARSATLTIGSNTASADGTRIRLAGPVQIQNGVIMLPRTFPEQWGISSGRDERSGAPEFCPLTVRKIVLDAGHGGAQPGAIGRTGLREKDVNLDIAKRLASLLRERGIEVVMTRTTDATVSLQKRAHLANGSGADLFVSIHSNANRSRSMNGFEVYHVSTKKDSARALTNARALLPAPAHCFASSSLDLHTIVWDLVNTANRAEAASLARAICRTANQDLGLEVHGVKKADYYVLKNVRIPAILIEVAFISNRTEEKLLRTGSFRQQVAESICRGIQHFSGKHSSLEASR